jgi:hypothetical protein
MTHISTLLSRSSHYAVLSAGLLLQAHSAFANDAIGDAQSQARAFLDPPVVHHAIHVETSSSTQTNDRNTAHPDAQAMARALLSGESIVSGAAQRAIVRDPKSQEPSWHASQEHRVYSDPQEAARRMILGIGVPAVATTQLIVRQR